MKCQFCTETATVHLTQIVGGKMQKIDLCEACAKEKGVSDPAGFSLADTMLGLGAAEQIKVSSSPDELICPQCGFTQPDFKKTGRMGCASCYETFQEGLTSILKDMHKGTTHKGKVPARCAQKRMAEEQLRIAEEQMRDFRRDLQKAIAEEKYEEAASLRDQISRLESQLK